MTKFRIPGLQVPAAADGETRAFFEGLKERLELAGGERGDPEQRAVSVRELREAGIAGVRTQNQYSRLVAPRGPSSGEPGDGEDTTQQLDFSLYPAIDLAAASGDLHLLAQGTTTNERFRIALQNLFSMFGRLDQESVPLFPWSFQAEDYGFDISGPAPRFRFNELSEDSDDELSVPVDSSIWEVGVSERELRIDLINDDEDTVTNVLCLGRDGMVGDYLDVRTTRLLHNGVQVLTRALRPATFVNPDGITVPINDVYIIVPFACTIRSVRLLTIGGPGSCVVDIWKESYANFPPTVANSICPTAKPTITGGIKYQDTTLTGWTTAVNAGDILAAHLESSTAFTMISMHLEVEPT